MYNPNVPSSNMGIAPISGQPSQPLGPTPMVGSAPMGPMGPPPPMAPPMMGGMPPPPMMAPPPMAPPIAPITEGLGGFGGSSAGRAGFSERMQRMTAPPKPRPMPQPMPVQRMNMGGAVSSQGLSMYQPPMMPRPMGMMGGVPNRVEPLRMALGGFIGNPLTRDYNRDFGGSDSSYEDEAYGDDGYGRVDYGGGGGDDSGGDDDDYYNYLDDDYVYVPPTIAEDLVVIPEPASGGDNRKDKVLADLIRTPVEVTSSPVVSDSAPVRDVSTSGVFVDPMSLETVAPVQLPVSAAPKAIDAVGAAPIVGSVESGEGEGASTEVDVLGANPISLSGSGITDRGKGMTVREMIASGSGNPNNVVIDRSNIPAVDSDFTARRAGEILDSLNVARPGGSSKTRIEDDGYANAMAAAKQVDASEAAAINALGSDAYTGVFEPEFVEPTPAEVMASNRRAMAEARADDASQIGRTFDPLAGVGKVTNLGSPIPGKGDLTNYLGGERYNPTSSLGLDPDPSDIQLEMAPSTDGGIISVPEGGPNFTARRAGEILESLKTAPRTTAASEAARRSMSDAPLGGSEALINPLPYTKYGLSRSSGVDAEARRLAQGILAGDNQLNAGGMYPKARDALDNAAKTAAFATQGMTPGTPEYLNTLIETADAASRAGDVPRQRVITDALQQPSGGMDDSSFIIPTTNQPQTFVGGRGPDYIDMTMPGKPSMLESTTDMSGIDSEGNVVTLAGASGYDTPAAAANRANALVQPATADPDGGGKIVPAKDYAESDYKSPGVLDDYVDPYEDQFVKDSYEQQLFGDPPKTVQAFGGLVKLLSGGLIDINKLTAEHRRKGLKAYLETNELAYENGVVVGVKDPEGRTIYLGPQSPKEEDNIGGDDDGCPPGFRRINGVCMPIRQNRVAANPATAISDSINKATLPSTVRPIVRDLVDDEDDEEETSDVGGLTIRRPNYFAGGGAVSEGMGSAIDSFISAMGGSVKKKSDVEPVNMFLGGLVDRFTGRNDYTDPYEELGRDYGYDPTDPFGDGDTSYGDDSPSDTVTADTFIGPMQPNVTYQPPAAPVDTGGDETDPFVKNAILSARNYYNDGSVGPTMQNASMLPAAPVNTAPQYGPSVDDRYAIDMTKYVPPGLRDVTQTLFDNDLASFNPVAGIYRAMDASGRIGKSISKGEEVDKNDMLTAGIETAIPALTLGLGKFLQQPVKQVLGNLFGIDVANPQKATNIKPSNETLTFYKGSPVAYDPEPGFPLGRARSAYSGTGEGNQRMGTPEALGEVLDARSGKAWGAGDYQTQSPSTATGYRFMRSGLDRSLQEAAVKAARDRVNFVDAGGRPDNFQTIFSEKIDAVDNAVKDASLGVKAAENVYADANRTAAELILDSSIFDTSRFRGDPRREIDPQGFYRSVVFGANDQIDEELYAIRDMIANRGHPAYNPGYSKRIREINRDFPNLINLTDKQIGERRAELRDLSKQYTGDVSKKYIDLTQTYRIAQDAEKAKKNLTDFETAVTADLPGVLYKTEIQEGNLGSFLDYDAPIDSQILTQATNALGVDAMNAKLFGTGPDAKKLQYNPKTQQYSFPRKSHNKFTNPDGSPIFANLPTERILAPQTVAEAKLYRDAGITHGQHKTGRKYKKVGDREIPIYNKIFFDDDVTPVPVGRYNRGGQVGMGLGSL